MTMFLDGREIASDILRSVNERMSALGRVPIVEAIVMRPTPATRSYLRIKTERAREAGMELRIKELAEDAPLESIKNAAHGADADAVIVQLPLPEHIDERTVLDVIPVTKDADILSSAAYERFLDGVAGAPLPPVVGAIKELLRRADVGIAGKRVVVLGNGRLVGKPAHAWLVGKGAEVKTLTHESFAENIGLLKDADIVIAGAGSPHLIVPSMLTRGVVLIDAGTSESGGAIVGDIDPACADIASVFTPVPGGVGPVAVACLFENAANLIAGTRGA